MKTHFTKISFLVNLAFMLALFFSQIQVGHAQLGKKLKQKIEEKAEKLLEKKPEEHNNDSTSQDASENTQYTPPDLSGLFGGSNVKLPNAYLFQSDLLMETRSFDANGKENTEQYAQIQYFFPSNEEEYLGMKLLQDKKTQEATMILQGTQMVTLTEENGTKMAIVMAMPVSTENENNIDDDGDEAMHFTKTGRTKNVLGYTCEEYEGEDEDSKVNVWITSALKEEGQKMLGIFGKMSSKQAKTPQQLSLLPLTEGMMLETETHDKRTGERNTFTAKDINADKKTAISTEGYQVMDMSGLMKKK